MKAYLVIPDGLAMNGEQVWLYRSLESAEKTRRELNVTYNVKSWLVMPIECELPENND